MTEEEMEENVEEEKEVIQGKMKQENGMRKEEESDYELKNKLPVK